MWRSFIDKYTYIGVHTQNFFTDRVQNQKKFGAPWSRCSEEDEDDGCGTKRILKTDDNLWTGNMTQSNEK